MVSLIAGRAGGLAGDAETVFFIIIFGTDFGTQILSGRIKVCGSTRGTGIGRQNAGSAACVTGGTLGTRGVDYVCIIGALFETLSAEQVSTADACDAGVKTRASEARALAEFAGLCDIICVGSGVAFIGSHAVASL